MSMEQNLDSLGMDRLGVICVGRRRHNEARRLNGVPCAVALCCLSFLDAFSIKGNYSVLLVVTAKQYEVGSGSGIF